MQHLMIGACIVAVVAFLVAMTAGLLWAGQDDKPKTDQALSSWDYLPWSDQMPYIPWNNALNDQQGVAEDQTY